MIGAILIISGLYLVVMGKSWESQALIVSQQRLVYSATEENGDEDEHSKERRCCSIIQPLITS